MYVVERRVAVGDARVDRCRLVEYRNQSDIVILHLHTRIQTPSGPIHYTHIQLLLPPIN